MEDRQRLGAIMLDHRHGHQAITAFGLVDRRIGFGEAVGVGLGLIAVGVNSFCSRGEDDIRAAAPHWTGQHVGGIEVRVVGADRVPELVL